MVTAAPSLPLPFPYPIPGLEVLAWTRTGSSVICDPPTLDTDRDYAILVGELGAFQVHAEADGWYFGKGSGGDGWLSARKRVSAPLGEGYDLNLIATADPIAFDLWCRATNLARMFNLREKDHRVALFRAIVDKVGPSGVIQ